MGNTSEMEGSRQHASEHERPSLSRGQAAVGPSPQGRLPPESRPARRRGWEVVEILILKDPRLGTRLHRQPGTLEGAAGMPSGKSKGSLERQTQPSASSHGMWAVPGGGGWLSRRPRHAGLGRDQQSCYGLQ